ncbi:LysR family transcriptional regulator [Sporomusa sphaeroides]|uniref:HTH-type transcriptional regulator CynR n=1 Tax=Sporomusa sphaeroides DSM 2875 TaxID=1337886 RepID=A0ABP2C8T0_9FIRM|nr:LysR family transcriptional regulator [Sporomusa sphaeroides]OLS54755.1 HTH-type transcriptional regulator CynR [Sporomusa sphaeroides DSM 2875]CVK20096.1 HTH-type transcriptional regulator CynR [Sporomusa sphaeroides DSM 2875]
MDIRDMRNFYAIVEAGNISNAAKRLNIAQPPLSKQMKQLEEQLGVQLFERGSRRIRLTEAGQLLRERAEQILGLVDGTVKEITELNSNLAGTLSIGTVTTSGATLLPNLLSRFHDLYPDVTFQLWEGDGYRILELLDNRVIEIGIIRAPFDSEIYESITLPDEPLMIAMKRDGCQCGEDPEVIRLAELAGQPLIIPRRWQAMVEEWCEKAGFAPNIVCLCDGILLNILWVKLGIGMALVPKSTEVLSSDAELIYKTIVEPSVSTQTVIVWVRNRNLSASSRHFLALLQDLQPE